MSEPTFTTKHGLYVADYSGPAHLRFELDHLHADSRGGDVTAELRVTSTAPGIEGLLHQTRYTLTGTQSRTTVARHLASRTPGQDLDWPGFIEQVSVKVLTAFRTGEPATLLRDAEMPPDPGALLPPIVLGRLPTIWFGDGATAKSLLALAAGLSIHSDQVLLGIAPTATRVVALLDWEMDAWEHKERMRRLVGEQMPDLVYVPCRSAIWDESDRLHRIFAEYGVTFAIIDSVGMACGGIPLSSDEAAIRFFQAQRQLEVGALCIAHKTKAEDGDKYPFGSAFWHYQARSTWYFRKAQEIDSNSLEVALHQRKANIAGYAAPLAFTVDFADSRIAIARKDARDTPALAGDLPVSYRMQRLLAAGGMSVADIAAELDESKDAVRVAAKRGEGKLFTTDEAKRVWLFRAQ